jgi:hypothetical protein
MSQLVDADTQRQVTQLIEKLTDKRKFALDPELARNLKRLCKASEQNIRAAFDAISEHLKANHAQVPPLPPPLLTTHSFQLLFFAFTASVARYELAHTLRDSNEGLQSARMVLLRDHACPPADSLAEPASACLAQQPDAESMKHAPTHLLD